MYKQDKSIQIHFIIGMPRSGTTWIGNCLGKHKDVAVFGESNFWGNHYQSPKDKNGFYNYSEIKRIQSILNVRTWEKTTGDHTNQLEYLFDRNYKDTIRTCFSSIDDKLKPEHLFTRICTTIAKDARKKIVFEKTPNHINFINRITDVYPNSKFLVLIRNPYDFLLSMKYMQDNSSKQYYLKRHSMLLALHWKKYMKSYHHLVNQNPNSVIAFNSEYIWTNTDEAFEKIGDFFELKGDIPISPNKYSNSSFNDRERQVLKSSDYFWINLILKDTIQKSEFNLQYKKTSNFEILFSIIMLPFALISSLSYLANAPNKIRYLLNWFSIKLG